MRRRETDKPGQIGEYWLSKRPNSPAWCRTWFDAASRQTRRASLETDNFDEAKIRLAEWITLNRSMRGHRSEDIELAVPLARYWEVYGSQLPSQETAAIALRYWLDFFEDERIAGLTPARQAAFVAWLRGKGHSDGYISRILSVGRAALNWSRKRGEILLVPFITDVQTSADKQNAPPKGRPLSLDEIAKLFDVADCDHKAMFLLISLNTLARPAAILDLTRSQVDFHEGLIDLNPPGRRQTKKHRPIVPMTETLAPALRTAPTIYEKRKAGKVLDRWPIDHFVTYFGRPIASFKTAFRTMRADAGLGKDVTPYSIRHSVGRELRRRRVPPDQISILLGHHPVSVKRVDLVYSPYDPDYCDQAKAAIEEICVDINRRADRKLIDNLAELRVSCVLADEFSESADVENPLVSQGVIMVGATGIEPVTPTMST